MPKNSVGGGQMDPERGQSLTRNRAIWRDAEPKRGYSDKVRTRERAILGHVEPKRGHYTSSAPREVRNGPTFENNAVEL